MKKETLDGRDVMPHPDQSNFTLQALSVIGQLPSLIISSAKSADDIISESLARVGGLFSASRAYVMLDEKGGRYLRNTHEWVNPTIGSARFSWPLYDYEHDVPSLKQILTDNTIFFAHSHDLPEDLSIVLSKQGVQSFVAAPVLRNGRHSGMLGMDFCDKKCPDCAEIIHVFECLAGVISLTLERDNYITMRGKLGKIRDSIFDLEPFLPANSGADDNPRHLQVNERTTLLDAERRIIMETLEMYNGNKLKTARHLGLTWPSLDRRCKKLGIVAKRK